MDPADLTAEPTLQQLEPLLRSKDPGHQLGAIQGWPPGPARSAVEATAAFNQDDWAMAESLLRQLLEHPFNNQQFFLGVRCLFRSGARVHMHLFHLRAASS